MTSATTSAPSRQPAGEVTIKDVSKLFQGTKGSLVWALRDVNITCAAGEFISLIGPSGCGKSTLLNMVAGFEHPTTGSIKVNGTEMRSPGPDRGFVFQEYAIFPWLTAVDNVRFGLRGRGLKKREQLDRAHALLKLVDLGNSAEKYPHELSGGMQQRVAIARALSLEPGVLLMDEPFGALDAQTRGTMQYELVKIWMVTQKTVMFVTHSVEEAVLLSDRIVVLVGRPGRISEAVTVALKRPRDVTSAEFGEVRRYVSNLLLRDSPPD
jgi:NitT/TauT family transport system ATP-binding protein